MTIEVEALWCQRTVFARVMASACMEDGRRGNNPSLGHWEYWRPEIVTNACLHQTSAMRVLAPIVEADLQPEQHGYRPRRSAQDTVEHVLRPLNKATARLRMATSPTISARFRMAN